MDRVERERSPGRPLTRRIWHARALLIAALVSLPACSHAPADPVEALVAELTAAAEDRDAERCSARLSEAFRGQGGLSRADAIAELRRHFVAYESIGLSAYALEIVRGEDVATVRFVVEFSGKARSLGGLQGLLPPSAVYRFTLETQNESGVWRVRSAEWEPAVVDEGS
jgi:hypothetical protein